MPVKILLIEDNPDHALITKKVLDGASKDYHVDSVSEPKGGLKSVVEGSYDLVICDYRLPGLSGLDILKEMKGKGKDLPFVVITSAGSEKVAVDLMKEGAYDYVVKDSLYEDTLPLVVEKSIERYNEKKEKERAELELRLAYSRLKETQEQLIQAEKLNAVGQLASGVAHEVKNPLGIIIQGINYLEDKLDLSDEGTSKAVHMIKNNVERADNIVRSLVDFSRITEIMIEPKNINPILEKSLLLIQHRVKLERIEVVKELKDGLPKVLVDEKRMEQVFINIFLNASQAMPEGGKLFIRSYRIQLNKPSNGIGRRNRDHFKLGETAVIVEVEDTGIGISEDKLQKVFDPFFTTKGPKEGAGLGLSVTRNIIDMHKGLIEMKSREGKGAKVIISLKIAGEK